MNFPTKHLHSWTTISPSATLWSRSWPTSGCPPPYSTSPRPALHRRRFFSPTTTCPPPEGPPLCPRRGLACSCGRLATLPPLLVCGCRSIQSRDVPIPPFPTRRAPLPRDSTAGSSYPQQQHRRPNTTEYSGRPEVRSGATERAQPQPFSRWQDADNGGR